MAKKKEPEGLYEVHRRVEKRRQRAEKKAAASAGTVPAEAVSFSLPMEDPKEIRTNIIMEEPLVMEAQAVTGIKTKTGVVHYALRELVRRARQREMLALRGQVTWEGDLEATRQSRPL